MAVLMNSHPQVASVGEVSPNRRILRQKTTQFPCSCGEPISTCEFWQQLFKDLESHSFAFSATQWPHRYRYPNPLLHRLLTQDSSSTWIGTMRKIAGAIMPFHRRRVAHADKANVAFVAAILNRANASLFFDTSKRLPRLNRLLKIPTFDVRVVRIVRDPRAFARSMRRKGATPESAARRWKDHHHATDRFMQRLPAEQVLTLRYEDLCRQPSASILRLCEFLEIARWDVPTQFDAAEHHIIGNSMRKRGPMNITLDDKWRRELTVAEIHAVESIAGDLLPRFGYA